MKLEEGEGLEGISRGLAYRLVETLGVLPRDTVTEEVKGLSQEDRGKLRANDIGVEIEAAPVEEAVGQSAGSC